VDAEAPIVLPRAARHGIADVDSIHAWAFAVDAYDLGEGLVVYIGPDRAGNLLEVGVADWHDELTIVHARRARPRFLR
jgi:hypothetical protein